MGYGSSTVETHRINLREFDGSDNWVEIKARRSPADVEACRVAGIKPGVPMESINGVVRVTGFTVEQFDFLATRAMRFRRHIVAWSLKLRDEDPEPMPLTDDVFRNVLDDDVSEWLSGEIEKYYESRKPTRDFLSTSNGVASSP